MKYAPKKRTLSLNSTAWKKLRAQVLAEEPLCRWCLARGLYVASTDVDHIKDSREDYSDDSRRENLTGLCHECHSLKTARDMGKSVYLGCDLNGMPIDPTHPWNLEIDTPKQGETSPETEGSKTAPYPLFYR